MKKIILIYVCVITLVNLVNAELVYNIDLTVYKNDTVELNKIWLYRGAPSTPQRSDYTLKILGKNDEVIHQTYLPVSFIILTEPPIETDKSVTSIALPYSESWNYLEVYHNNKLIFRKEGIKLCNLNRICDPNEDYVSCPQDCPKPSVTLPATTILSPEKPKGIGDYLPHIVILFIIILLAFLIHRKLEARKIERERKEFKIWKLKRELEKIKRG